MATLPPFRVIIYDSTSARAIGNVLAIIDDAKDIGGSSYANDSGEFFMTLPWNHPQISVISPLQTHYSIQKRIGGTYTDTFVGLIDDYDATRDEVVFYGRDYLSLLATSITTSTTSYNNTAITSIISTELNSAISATNSRMAFITANISTASTTATVISAFESRLHFIQGLIQILQADGTTRPILQSPASSFSTFNFNPNQGSDLEDIRLEYGGLLQDFRYNPGYSSLITTEKAIGQKRDGASILYSTQTYASPATYGLIESPEVFLDIANQTALDNRAKHSARLKGTLGTNVSLSVRVGQLAPFDGYNLGDALRVVINRGIVSVNALYTLWGLEWTGTRDGSEALFLDLRPKDT